MLPEKQDNRAIILPLSFHFADHSTIHKRKAILLQILQQNFVHQINNDRVWVAIEPLAMNPLLEKDKDIPGCIKYGTMY